MKPSVSIGIPTYNGWVRVHQLLQNIQQRTSNDIPYEVIVCDDSGRSDHQDHTREVCRSLNARYIQHDHNRGVPSAWNSLTKAANADYMILLNDDILLAKDWLTFHYYAIVNNPNAGSIGLHCYFITPEDVPTLLSGPNATVMPLYVRYENGNLITNQRHTVMPQDQGGGPGRVMCPTGCAFGFSKETYNKVGGFDEQYRCFYEETDFGVTCSNIGLPAFQLSNPGNYHLWSQTFRSAPEINAGSILNDSRRKFVQKWSKKLGIKFNDAPDIHNLIMDKIPLFEVKWLDNNYQQRVSVV